MVEIINREKAAGTGSVQNFNVLNALCLRSHSHRTSKFPRFTSQTDSGQIRSIQKHISKNYTVLRSEYTALTLFRFIINGPIKNGNQPLTTRFGYP